MTARRGLALALGLGGVLLALALIARQSGVIGSAGPRVRMDDATAAMLDTVAVRGRIVTASVGGTVVQVSPGGQVWLSSGGDAFPLRFPTDPELAVEDHVLAVGRVRARGGRRWLAVESWARVEPAINTPAAPGL